MKPSIRLALFFVISPIGLGAAFSQANPQLVCDSVSASKSKCGFAEFIDPSSPPRFFLQEDFTFHAPCPCCNPGCWAADVSCYYSVDVDTCPEASNGCQYTEPNYGSGGLACDGRTVSLSSVHSVDEFRYGYNNETTVTSTLIEYYEDFGTVTNFCDGSPTHYWEQETFQLSSEYTSAMLISNTVGALPPYPGTFTGTCSAYRNLSSDETSYTIQRFKYKFTFPAAARPFIIRWEERFRPEGGGSPSDTFQSEFISSGATQTNVHEVLEPSSDGTVTIQYVCVDPVFDYNAPNACIASPDATPSDPNTLGPTVLGKTGTENVDIDITVCSDGTNWRAILTGLTGHYSKQARLLPGPPPMQGVTGPNGNTTQQNFCDQAAALYCLAAIDCLGYIPVWYMLLAVQDHEQVHANHMTPALQNAAPDIETLVESQAPNETLNVPDSGQTAQEALDQIRASTGFANAKIAGLSAWSAQYASLSANDHNGPCQEAERLVVDPMIAQICDYANTHVWQPLCPVCPYPPPPLAPIANAATNVTSTSFSANWSSVASTAGYRLDVSTTNSFTSYVSGYQNLDVGNVTTRSVSGLIRNTNYYYRVRAYNLGGTTGNSNVQNVKTKPH